MGEAWRMAECECPEDAKPGERCNRQWTRCRKRLAYLSGGSDNCIWCKRPASEHVRIHDKLTCPKPAQATDTTTRDGGKEGERG